jgi:hypothetical protein
MIITKYTDKIGNGIYKYIFITLIGIILASFLVLSFFSKKDSFENNYTANISNINNNKYTSTVNLPLNDSQGCQNACYNAKCSKTGKQCSTDTDCYEDGCQSLLKQVHDKFVAEQSKPLSPQKYVPADTLATGRLIYNQNPQHSALTYDISTTASEIDINAQVPRPYRGYEKWEPVYNAKAQLIDDELAYEYAAAPEQYRSTPVYKPTLTATGMFYDIGPTPANATLS